MKVSVVVSTYNQPRTLEFCLVSLMNQSYRDFDLFVADDGSTSDTRELVERYSTQFRGGISYFWQEDEGFRKGRIHNQVFSKLRDYEITICVDGDTFQHWKFIEDHMGFHRNSPRTVVMGRRVDLGPKFTESLTVDRIPQVQRGLDWRLLLSGFQKDSERVLRSIRIPNRFLRTVLNRDEIPDLLGSNFSLSTGLLFEVNGYDETLNNYWGEDGDLFIRLRNVGAKLMGSRSVAIQFHLYHPRRLPHPSQVARYERDFKRQDYRWCPEGIVKEPTSTPQGLSFPAV